MSDDLTMTYTATLTEDYLGQGVYSYYKSHNGSKTLGVQRLKGRVNSIAVHGNNRIIIKRGTKDVSDKYVYRRYWRIWDAALPTDGGDVRLGDYQDGGATLVLDGEKKDVGNWYDVPGQRLSSRCVTWHRVLLEFAVGCQVSYNNELAQGIGGLHLVIIVDFSPTGYRVGMSKGYELTEEQIRSVTGHGSSGTNPFPLDSPLKTESDIAPTDWLARHTTWQDYASVNSQLPLG